MSSKRPLISLRMAGISLIDCDHKTPKAQEQGRPYVGIPQLKDGRITLNGARLISEEDFHHWRRKTKPTPDDVVLSRRCNPGESSYVPNALEFALGQNLVLLRSDGTKIYPPFLRWLTQGTQWWSQVNMYINVGAVFDSLKCADIPKFEIYLPELNEQKRIAETLGGLDGKIQINHKINQTLEQMAQAIFKSWFVDFEPVKAKIAALEAGGSEEDALLAAMQAIAGDTQECTNTVEGSAPGAATGGKLTRLQAEQPEQYATLCATAELFPSAMQDSELGEIPEGWEVGALADLADLNKKSWTKRTIPSEIEYVDLANTKNGIIESTTVYASDDAPSRARRKFSDGDTIIGTVRPGNRSFAFIQQASEILTGSTGFAALSPKHKAYSEFVYIAATSNESINHLAHLADGGAYPAVRPEVISRIITVIPSNRVLERFHELTCPYFEHSASLKAESSLLARTKDTLLPRLLSGELCVSKAESELTRSEEVADV